MDCVLELDPPKWELIQATTSQLENNLLEPIGHYDLWDNTHMRQERAMTLKEYSEYVRISGNNIMNRLKQRESTIKRLDDEKAQNFIDKIIRRERELAKHKIK